MLIQLALAFCMVLECFLRCEWRPLEELDARLVQDVESSRVSTVGLKFSLRTSTCS